MLVKITFARFALVTKNSRRFSRKMERNFYFRIAVNECFFLSKHPLQSNPITKNLKSPPIFTAVQENKWIFYW